MIKNDFMLSLMDSLTAPIITYSESWADVLPKRIIDLVTMNRLIQSIKKEEMASWPEVVLYLMTASLEHPIGSDWTDIYCYASCRVEQDHFNNDYWDQLFPQRKLSRDQERYVTDLRKWIYERRRRYVSKYMSDQRKSEKQEKNVVPAIISVQPKPEQLTLW